MAFGAFIHERGLDIDRSLADYDGAGDGRYAERVLFRKLGIEDYDWKERDGLTLGCTGLHMRSGDMVKLGLLMLNRGEAGGERLIPAAWVDESTRRQSEGHPAWFGHYGLHWWVSDARHNGIVDLYFALGAHGQFLIVAPERRLVACIRKKVGALADSGLPLRFFLDRVLPAVG